MKSAMSIIIVIGCLSMTAHATPGQNLTAAKAPMPTAKPAPKAKAIVHPVLLKAKKKRAERASQTKQPVKHLDLSGAFKTGR